MKKVIALWILLCVAILVAFTPTQSQAATAERQACGPTVKRSATKTLAFVSDGGGVRVQARGGNETVRFVITVSFRQCGRSAAYVQRVTSSVIPDFTGCIGGLVQNYKVNSDTIGRWNPSGKTIDCTRAFYYSVYSNNPVANKYVFASDSAARRCMKTRVQVSLNDELDVAGSTRSICVV